MVGEKLVALAVLDGLIALTVLCVAFIVELLFGDPSPNYPSKLRFRLHPTVWMGQLSLRLKKKLKNKSSKIEKFNGIVLAIVVILAFSLPVFLLLHVTYSFLGVAVYVIAGALILKCTMCIKLESDWAIAAAQALEQNKLEEARQYSHFSRRESKGLTGPQISSAVIESMAENLTDFKISPILAYAVLGVSGAVAFRAINTLDGMVGFKDEENINIGWFSAQLDTLVNFVPARLAAALIVLASFLLGGDYKNAWRIAKRDNAKTPSRNHGWPMAAMAGALRVELEKPGQYILGDSIEELTPKKILDALRIRNMAILLAVLLSLPIIFFVRVFFFPF